MADLLTFLSHAFFVEVVENDVAVGRRGADPLFVRCDGTNQLRADQFCRVERISTIQVNDQIALQFYESKCGWKSVRNRNTNLRVSQKEISSQPEHDFISNKSP